MAGGAFVQSDLHVDSLGEPRAACSRVWPKDTISKVCAHAALRGVGGLLLVSSTACGSRPSGAETRQNARQATFVSLRLSAHAVHERRVLLAAAAEAGVLWLEVLQSDCERGRAARRVGQQDMDHSTKEVCAAALRGVGGLLLVKQRQSCPLVRKRVMPQAWRSKLRL